MRKSIESIRTLIHLMHALNQFMRSLLLIQLKCTSINSAEEFLKSAIIQNIEYIINSLIQLMRAFNELMM
jgi:hypothetical protein